MSREIKRVPLDFDWPIGKCGMAMSVSMIAISARLVGPGGPGPIGPYLSTSIISCGIPTTSASFQSMPNSPNGCVAGLDYAVV